MEGCAALMHAGDSRLEHLSLDQTAVDLSDPFSPMTQDINGSTNYLIAALRAVRRTHEPGMRAKRERPPHLRPISHHSQPRRP